MELLIGLGYFSSLAVYLVPMLTMGEVKRAQSVGERSALPFVAALLTTGMWILCGRSPPRRDVLVIRNAMGSPFLAFYAAVFLRYYTAVDRMISLLYILPGFFGFVALLALFFADSVNTTLLGRLCAVAGCATPLLPFLHMRTLWRTRSVQTMPSPPLAALSLINALIWSYNTVFLLKPRDWCTVIPNVIAAFAALLQLVIHFVCWLKGPETNTLAADDINTPLLQASVATATTTPTDTVEGGARATDAGDDIA